MKPANYNRFITAGPAARRKLKGGKDEWWGVGEIIMMCELTNQCICLGGTRVSCTSHQLNRWRSPCGCERSTALYRGHPPSEEFTMRLLLSTVCTACHAMPCRTNNMLSRLNGIIIM